MKQFIDKLIGRLEEKVAEYDVRIQRRNGDCYYDERQNQKKLDERARGIEQAIEIVNQLAEEYNNKREEVASKLLNGEWVDTEDVEKYLGIDFKLGFRLFDFSRTAEWNPAPLNVQNIITKFRMKCKNNGWILVSEKMPDFLDNVLVCTKNGGRTIAHLKHTPIEWRDMYMNKIDDVIAWKHLDAPC